MTETELKKRIEELDDECNDIYDELIETMRFDPMNLIYIKHLEEKLIFKEYRLEEYQERLESLSA